MITYIFTNKINLFTRNLKQLTFFENIDLSRTKIDRIFSELLKCILFITRVLNIKSKYKMYFVIYELQL